MATAKAKLHQLLCIGTDKEYVYETRLVMGGGERGGEGGEPGELFLQPGVRVGADGLLQVLPGEHTTPMFACTLRLPDGTSVESGRFRRKREAEQDAALRGLHKVGIIAPNFVLLKSFKSFLCTSLDFVLISGFLSFKVFSSSSSCC
jgi:hypothetical protein